MTIKPSKNLFFCTNVIFWAIFKGSSTNNAHCSNLMGRLKISVCRVCNLWINLKSSYERHAVSSKLLSLQVTKLDPEENPSPPQLWNCWFWDWATLSITNWIAIFDSYDSGKRKRWKKLKNQTKQWKTEDTNIGKRKWWSVIKITLSYWWLIES